MATSAGVQRLIYPEALSQENASKNRDSNILPGEFFSNDLKTQAFVCFSNLVIYSQLLGFNNFILNTILYYFFKLAKKLIKKQFAFKQSERLGSGSSTTY